MSDTFITILAIVCAFGGWIAGLLTARDFPNFAKSITHPDRK